jgi:uncharacterized metal-binding protein YceD (DUF177 family)
VTPELSRPVALERLHPGAHAFAHRAAPAELAAVAARLELAALHELALTGALESAGAGAPVRVRATLVADLEEVCVVTLEPFRLRLEVPVERLFDPAAGDEGDAAAAADDLVLDPLAVEAEPLDGAVLDLGEIAVEELALARDPYPRSPAADQALAAALPAASDGPLGPLARLLKPRA